MAQKLSITLALEGGAELQRQLKDIGTAGQKAFLDISKAAEQVGGFAKIDPSAVTAQFKEMGITSVAEINKIQDALQSAVRTEKMVGAVSRLEDGFSSLRSGVQAVGVTFASIFNAALIQQTIGAVFKLAEAITAVDTEAIKLGKSVGEFDQLRHGFAQMGIAAKEAADGIARFDLSNVERAAKVLEEASKRGFGGLGTSEMATLQKAAQNVGAAGDLARKTLEGLGQSTDDLDKKFGTSNLTLIQFIERLSRLPDSAERTRLATSRLGDEMGTSMIQMLRLGASADELKQKFAGTLTQEDANRANSLKLALTQLGDAWERFKNLIGVPAPLLQDIADITGALKGWSNLLGSSGGAWTNWYAVASQALLNAGQYLKDLAISIGHFGASLGGDIWAGFASGGAAAIQWVGSWVDWLIDKFKEAGRWVASLFGGGGGAPAGEIPGHASGGMIGGRGTGTSDSNLAWVSRGEHIMPARAVAQPGVLAFLEALRRSGGNLSRVLDGMGRYAAGGLVMPSLASAGIGGSASNVTIQFPGLPAIGGLRASSQVVEELQRAAAMAQVRSGGRKPSRYR